MRFLQMLGCRGALWSIWLPLSLASSMTSSLSSDADAEMFPLSGGVRNGISVKVDVTGYSSSGAKLEFRTPSGSNAFSFEVQSASQQIVRQSAETAAQSWGKWPLGASSGPVSFEFLKTRHMWHVSIDSQRTPWFDFPVSLAGDPVVHLMVGSGFEDVTVVQDRPVCTKGCHPDECRNATGSIVCVTAEGEEVEDPSQCMRTRPSSARGAADDCTAGTDVSGLEEGHCCTGMENNMEFDSIVAGAWARLSSDQAFLDRSCAAFGGNCAGLAGKRVKVNSKNVDDHFLSCWSPESTPSDESAVQQIPDVVLFQQTLIGYNISVPKAQAKLIKTGNMILEDSSNLLLVDIPAGSNLERYWFVNMIHERAPDKQHDQEPWVYWIKDRWDYWADEDAAIGMNVLLTNIPIPQPACEDWAAGWQDTNGNTCQLHADNDLCNVRGHRTAKWIETYGEEVTFGSVAAAGLYAPKACCVCGGGRLDGSDAAAPGNLFQWPVFPEGYQDFVAEIETKESAGEVSYV